MLATRLTTTSLSHLERKNNNRMSENANTGVRAGSPVGLHVQSSFGFGFWQRKEVKLLSNAYPGTVAA